MKIWSHYFRGAAVFLIGLMVGPSFAAVDVLEAEGNLEHWVLYYGAHGPCSGASWSHAIEEGTIFDDLTGCGEDCCIVSSWGFSCSPDGFIYSGELAPVTTGVHGWSIYIQCQMTVLIDVTTPTWITATRTAEGIYTPSDHAVTLVLPDGTSENLFGSDRDTESGERFLDPGLYRVTLSLDSDWVWDIPFSYSGLVEVNWSGAVDSDVRTWGDIKSLYRSRP